MTISRFTPPIAFLSFALSLTNVAAAQDKTTDPLPVRAVTLFSSGVSYTLREGEVNNDATVALAFRTAQINDILKSLVLLDERGTIQPAVYGAKDPIGRALQSFAVDLTQPMDRVSLLNRLKGAKVEVRVSIPNGEETVTGQIIGVEEKTEITRPNESPVTVDYLTLLTETDLQTVRLDSVKSLRLLDPKLDKEFRDALTLLASGADDKRRSVTLKFSGQGKRRVRVGYIAEAPLWKISYRLLIGGETGTAGEKPYLQGWALVENTTDDDWNNVSLSLVSGRPISFIQDLYQPLYLPRPIVPPDVVASPNPQIAEAAVENAPPAIISQNADALSVEADKKTESLGMLRRSAPGGGFGGGGGGFGGGGFAGTFRDSVAAQATGQKAGELFQYNIKTPVNLPRQQAAMIPIIAQDIDGEKVSLYNADSDARFPLNAFRIKNNTKLHLKGGPVTIFDNGIYAGDARMEDIPPADSRLVTYAVDLAVEGERQSTGSQTEMSLVIRRGVLEQTLKDRSETTYTLLNKDDKPRTVLVEHPFNPEYKLLAPTVFEERTPNWYRFAVVVPASGSKKLSVVLERPILSSYGLLDSDLNTVRVWQERKETSATVKEALTEVLSRRQKLQDIQQRQQNIASEIKQISDDQERVRKNMIALDKTSALYQRYVKQLDEQETTIQALQTESTRLRSEAADAEQNLRHYLDTLNIGI
jgi:uncharacterized membrane protein YgcG